ncbi:MAG: hypothetical protein ACJ8AT_22280 [Hyalangium sp.]|uniref:hypothetical protein n=1 Tax=Hyalangium sp. TaxID=2028555 RepID=UPI00389AA187
MVNWNLRGCVLAMVSAVVLVSCSSGRNEALKPVPQDSTERPARPASQPDAGASTCASCGPNDQCVNGRCVCQPLTCSSGGKRCGQVSDGCGGVIDCGRCSRCGPDEMECCGACISKAEGRCPENVHCPTSLPDR